MNQLKKNKTKWKKTKKGNMVENIDSGKCFELATANKRYVNGIKLHESKIEILLDYTDDFGLIGSTLIGEIEQKTNVRFKNMDAFESYINGIDNSGYDSDDVIFTRWLYKKTHLNSKK